MQASVSPQSKQTIDLMETENSVHIEIGWVRRKATVGLFVLGMIVRIDFRNY